MAPVSGRRRLWYVLAALGVGIVLFWMALVSTGAGHGSYWAVFVFYPLQFFAAVMLYDAFGGPGSDGLFVAIAAVFSLPWYPLIVFLFTSRSQTARFTAIGLLILQAIGGVVFALSF